MPRMKAYSNDLRRKVVSAYERSQLSQREVAELFVISPATVRNFVRGKRERGSPDALPRGGSAHTLLDEKARREASANSSLHRPMPGSKKRVSIFSAS